MSLTWRLLLVNAAVLSCAAVALALTPATVSYPVALTEVVMLVLGVGGSLLVNVLLLRRVLAPLRRLVGFVRGVDPLRPGARAPVAAATDAEVRDLTAAINEMVGRLEEERRESAQRALGAQEAERTRVARELHDEVGQLLTAVVLELDLVARRSSSDVAGPIERAREEVRASLERVRDIARGLRPEALDDLGLRAALDALASDLSRRTRLAVDRRLAAAGDLPALTPAAELVVYRVAQEALTNVARHADARSARLEVTMSEPGPGVQLRVSDDGKGFDVDRSAGSGLRGMRERAVLAGAALEIASAPGRGTTVSLRVPSG